jgi:hypothetical protein
MSDPNLEPLDPTPAAAEPPKKSSKSSDSATNKSAAKPTASESATGATSPDKPPIDDLKMPEDKPSRWQRLKSYVHTHRTRVILLSGLIVIIPTAAWAYIEFNKPVETVSSDVHVAKKEKKATTKPSPLTGIEVEPALAERPITGVVIENHTDARPQSGLGQAGVVYEALAEGGITRFLAFYVDTRPSTLGPVRSIRTYFVDWGLEFKAPIAHAGGNADALDLIGPLGLKDLNQFNYGDFFWRANDRYAPHNLYTSSDKLDALEKKLGYTQPAAFTPSPRQADKPATTPDHPDININYSYNGYQVEYKYDTSCNCYLRFLAGAPHVDRNDNQQIKVKNVVVEYMPTSYGTTRIGEQTVMMGTPGSGKAIVFRDGTAIEATWSKATHGDRTKLMDSSGKEIPLNTGNTWYSIVPTDKPVSY